jgi:hypothetical protein
MKNVMLIIGLFVYAPGFAQLTSSNILLPFEKHFKISADVGYNIGSALIKGGYYQNNHVQVGLYFARSNKKKLNTLVGFNITYNDQLRDTKIVTNTKRQLENTVAEIHIGKFAETGDYLSAITCAPGINIEKRSEDPRILGVDPTEFRLRVLSGSVNYYFLNKKNGNYIQFKYRQNVLAPGMQFKLEGQKEMFPKSKNLEPIFYVGGNFVAQKNLIKESTYALTITPSVQTHGIKAGAFLTLESFNGVSNHLPFHSNSCIAGLYLGVGLTPELLPSVVRKF